MKLFRKEQENFISDEFKEIAGVTIKEAPLRKLDKIIYKSCFGENDSKILVLLSINGMDLSERFLYSPVSGCIWEPISGIKLTKSHIQKYLRTGNLWDTE